MLSIVIVNYKTPLQLLNCVNSIYFETKNIPFEIIIVDNNSQDSSKKIVNHLKELKWIQLYQNVGFAKANNIGINNSKGDIILLLNSDTVILNNAIGNCYNQFINSNYVACGVQLLFHDLTPQVSGSYFMKGALNNLLPLPIIGKTIKFLGTLTKVKNPNIFDSQKEIEVDWIKGAFLMLKKEALEKSGLFDEDFFLYSEEVELCSRLKKYGKLCIYGQYNVIQLEGKPSEILYKSTTKGYQNFNDTKGK